MRHDLPVAAEDRDEPARGQPLEFTQPETALGGERDLQRITRLLRPPLPSLAGHDDARQERVGHPAGVHVGHIGLPPAIDRARPAGPRAAASAAARRAARAWRRAARPPGRAARRRRRGTTANSSACLRKPSRSLADSAGDAASTRAVAVIEPRPCSTPLRIRPAGGASAPAPRTGGPGSRRAPQAASSSRGSMIAAARSGTSVGRADPRTPGWTGRRTRSPATGPGRADASPSSPPPRDGQLIRTPGRRYGCR